MNIFTFISLLLKIQLVVAANSDDSSLAGDELRAFRRAQTLPLSIPDSSVHSSGHESAVDSSDDRNIEDFNVLRRVQTQVRPSIADRLSDADSLESRPPTRSSRFGVITNSYGLFNPLRWIYGSQLKQLQTAYAELSNAWPPRFRSQYLNEVLLAKNETENPEERKVLEKNYDQVHSIDEKASAIEQDIVDLDGRDEFTVLNQLRKRWTRQRRERKDLSVKEKDREWWDAQNWDEMSYEEKLESRYKANLARIGYLGELKLAFQEDMSIAGYGRHYDAKRSIESRLQGIQDELDQLLSEQQLVREDYFIAKVQLPLNIVQTQLEHFDNSAMLYYASDIATRVQEEVDRIRQQFPAFMETIARSQQD